MERRGHIACVRGVFVCYMRTGILGGSFDPVHYGHLAIADDVRVRYSLDHVLFVPARQQPLKQHQHAPSEHRLAMVQLACETHPAFAVSDIELQRDAMSYTVTTLELLSTRIAGTLLFIVGADAAQELPRWHRVEDIHRFADIVVVGRPNTPYLPDETIARIPSLDGHVSFIPGPALQLSSTSIRQRVTQQLPIRYLVPDAVATYIAAHRLYQHQ